MVRLRVVPIGAIFAAFVAGVLYGAPPWAAIDVPGRTYLAIGAAAVAAVIAWLSVRGPARTLEALAPPLLRATSTPGDTLVPVGPGLAELLGARGVLLLSGGPGARRLTPAESYRLREADLLPDAPLDPRRSPYRGDDGLARPATATGIVDLEIHPGAWILPLSAGGVDEGWLLVVPAADATAPERIPSALAAISAEAARALRRRRLADGEALVDAACALETDGAALSTALAQARIGLLFCSPDGRTRWKNARWDALLAHRACAVGADLPRVLALLGEGPPARTLEALLDQEGPTDWVAQDLRIVFSTLRSHPGGPAHAILVEIDVRPEA